MTQSNAGASRGTAARRPVQLAAVIVGVVFLVVGILGFIPGITTDNDRLGIAGTNSRALLLGVFGVSALHNLVHGAFGIAGLLLARTATGARNFLLYGGIIYAVLWIYGLIIDHDSAANFVPVNTADNWLHLGLAIGMIALGTLLTRSKHDQAVRGV